MFDTQHWRLYALMSCFGVVCLHTPALAQMRGGISLDATSRRGDIYSDGPYREVSLRPAISSPSGSGTVSADELRHPLSDRTRSHLRKVRETIDAGEHAAAIEQLKEVLAKDPDAAISAHALLGIEYMRTEQFHAAANSFERAVAILPRDAVTRYNFGLSLVCAGQIERGEQEVRRAVEIDPNNKTMQALLARLAESKVLVP
jgi:tetratricopeptide (TPR) repeat protein